MAKKITLEEIGETLSYIVKHMATKDDLKDGLSTLEKELKAELASKSNFFSLQTQVNSIESHIRGMNYVRIEGRVADLEEKVFGKAR